MCRGLVTNAEGSIVGRSFNKFHNVEANLHKPTDDFVVFEKLDGSLIMLFHYDGEWQVASRGSFSSPQASTARQMLQQYDISHLDTALTHVFEIIYSNNRIVVDYGSRHELVFLAAFDPHGAEHMPHDEVIAAGFRIVRRFDGLTDYRSIKHLDWPNAEGFVVRFGNGERVKVKFDTYCKLHKMMSGLDEDCAR